MVRSRSVALGIALAAGVLLSTVGVPAGAVPMAASDLTDCLARGDDGTGHGCYGMEVLQNKEANAKVRVTWDRHASSEGFTDANWQGGLWTERWPIAGQGRSTKDPRATWPANTVHEDCTYPFEVGKCASLMPGPKATLTIPFRPEDAGYVYELVAHDNICSDDQASCGPSGGTIGANGGDTYAWIFKASKYTKKNGTVVITRSCPKASLRKTACEPATLAMLSHNIPGGEPVDPPAGASGLQR